MRRWTRAVLAAVLAGGAAAACGGGGGSAERSVASDAAGYAGQAPPSAPTAVMREEAMRAKSVADAPAAAPAPRDPLQGATDSAPAAPSMIIRTGQATIEVDSLEPAVARVRELARRVGGFVASTSMQTGRDQMRSATLELKLPAPRWDDAVGGLRPIGEVESVTEQAQDVGEEYVDIQARVANARRLETRLVELLERRTGKLEDVLAVERELARVREEIERYEGRLRWLRSRVALSTLSVTVHEPPPIVGAPGQRPIADAFRQAWRNFVGFVAWFIGALGWMIPVGALVVLALWLLRRLRVFRPRRAPRPPAAGTEPGERAA